ncbi:MAG: type II toxin-antitoxin system VapC family toxin [Fimbriimonadales bacterium]
MLLDTNTLIYHLRGMLDPPLGAGEYFASIISEIELLSYPDLSADEETGILQMLAQDVYVMQIDPEVKSEAISLRRTHKLKLHDAIILRTA